MYLVLDNKDKQLKIFNLRTSTWKHDKRFRDVYILKKFQFNNGQASADIQKNITRKLLNNQPIHLRDLIPLNDVFEESNNTQENLRIAENILSGNHKGLNSVLESYYV